MKQVHQTALVCALLLTVGGYLWVGASMAASILIGAVLAVLNFHFMARGVDRALGRPTSRKPAWDVAFFLLRLVLIFGTLFVIIQTSFLSLLGAVLGLSIYVLAGMLQAILLLIQQLNPRR